ncbi:MAG: choice-of-anchor D domain-containing protein [Hyalangium sp.]|uniref:choice-of-anchor D domain-containing protein n=1 Tax=Hyalangium sp. TaxID=2028555 RepID=UPI00389A4C72
MTFTPTVPGATSATLTLSTSDVAKPTIAVALSGTGVNPTAVVASTLAFGEQSVGATPAPTMALGVRNSGTGTLHITNAVLSGADSARYSVSPTTLDVPAGQILNLTVTFTPTALSATSATLTLTTNDVAKSTITVGLSGTGVNPIAVVASTVAFGEQRVGATPAATMALGVRNNGTGTLHITNAVLSGTDSARYSISPATLDVPSGQSLNLTVTFTPTVPGATSATLTFSTNDVARPTIAVDLSGTGVNPTISVPLTLPFGEKRLNTPAVTMPLVVGNTGSGTLSISNIAKSGPGAAYFTFTPNVLSVGAQDTGTINVSFNPTAEGSTSATLTLTTSDVNKPTVTVTLTGTGVAPVASVPATLSFGDQRVGAIPSPTVTLAVSNTGSGTLHITNPVLSGGGATVYSVSPSTLDVPGTQSRNLTVTFSPTVVGTATATLTLNTDDVGKPTVSVALSGVGVNPTVTVQDTLPFGDKEVGVSSTLTLSVGNTGSGNLHISNPTLTGTGAAFYTISPSTLDVASGQSLPLTVTFTPTVVGQADATLTLTTNTVGRESVNVALTGYGGRPSITLDPPSLDFAGVRVGTTLQQKVTIHNDGRAPLKITSAPTVSPSGTFSYVGQSAFTIPAGGQFDVQVSFAPTQTTSYGATLNIVSNAPGSPTSLPLSGFGANPQMSVSPSSIFFGDVRVNDKSTAQTITLTVTNSTGEAYVELQNLTVVGPFSFKTVDTLPHKIKSGTSYAVTVQFNPSSPSADGTPTTGSITINTDLPQQPTVALSGNGIISKAEVSVTSLDFGAQRVDKKSGSLPVIVSNTGKAELQISGLSFSNAEFALDSSPVYPLTVAAGAKQALFVTFSPSTLGDRAGKLSIISNAYGSVPQLDLTGTGVDGQMSFTPSDVAFGHADVGSTGVQQSVVLKNTGAYPLTISTVVAPSDLQFTVSGLPNGLVLQPDATWPFIVTYTPSKRGYTLATSVITSDAQKNTTFNLAMSGTGDAAAVELQPTDIYFGATNVGVPITQDISVKNVGEKALSVSNIAFADTTASAGDSLDFSLDSSVALPLVVDPGASKLVRLKFTPSKADLRQAKANFYTNVVSDSGVVTATVGGRGTSPTMQLLPTDLAFSNVLVGNASAPQLVKITNTGNGPLTLSTMKLVGPDAAAFIMTAPDLPAVLPPKVSTTVSVSLKPDAERLFSAQIQLQSNDVTAPTATVGLSGAGVGQQIQVSETALDFGYQLLNKASSARVVRVTNSGDTTLTLSSVTVEGDGASQFAVTKPALPIDLKPADTKELSVTFTALSEADVNCTLKLVFGNSPVPRTVTLHGKGIPSVLSATPSPLDFGVVRLGSQPRPRTLQITNLSSERITLARPVLVPRSIDKDSFSIALDAPVEGRVIGPGAFTTLTINYAPPGEVLSEATLSFDTLGPAQPHTLDVALKGRATQHLLTVDPGSLDFGRVDVSSPVEPKQITVVNSSTQEQRVVVKLKTLEGTHFSLNTKTLDSGPLAAGGSVTFDVSFIPEAAGEEDNVVQVYLQNEAEPEAEISVTGHGRQLMGKGGGGCSSTSASAESTGLLALLALVALRARRRRRE